MRMYLRQEMSKKSWKYIFGGIMEAPKEKSRIRIRIRNPVLRIRGSESEV